MSEISQIALQLQSADSEERIAAVRQIPSLKNTPMKLFSLGLGDPDWRVRKAAVEAFCQLERPELFIAELIAFLHDPENAGLRNSAIELLIGLGPLAVAKLQAEMSGRDVEVRKFIIDILGEIGDPGCADELIRSLTDTDINVRYACVETLGKLRVERAIDPLLDLMTDPDPGLKFTILNSLAQIGGKIPPARLFEHLKDRLLRKALFDCFAKVGGPEVIPSLIDGLTDPMRQVREAALMALFELMVPFETSVKAALIEADKGQIAAELEHVFAGENQKLKEAALCIYSPVAASRDLHPLLSCVMDEHLRRRALDVFTELGADPYSRLLNSFEPHSTELLLLIFIGGELGFSQCLSFAVDGACDGDPQLRHTAVRALGQLGDAKELKLLIRLLDDEIPEVQDAAAEAIASIGRQHKEDVLRNVTPLLEDQGQPKRVRIVRILSLLEGDDIDALLLRAFKDSSSQVRCEAVRALVDRLSEPVVAGVILALTDESAEVRRLAVSALGQYPQSRALPALLLAAKDSDLWVRASVMRMLKHFSGDEVWSLLLRGVADPVGIVSIAALETASVVCPAESRLLLEDALAHNDEEVVKAAMSLLNQLYDEDWIVPFVPALLGHAHWDVRIHAARILGDSRLQQASQWLTERLRVEDESLVHHALEAALSSRLRLMRQGH